MAVYKNILIFLILLIFTYILWRLICKRQEIMKKISNGEKLYNDEKKEGFSFFTTPDSEFSNIQNSNPVLIQGINSNYAKLPLREYIIKSSFNSAITGNYVNLDMIQYVLKRGCRFLDFEVFYIDNSPVVAYSTDKNFDTIDTDNHILLDAVLSSAVANAFSSTSPNSGDPLFIHLRIKSNNPNIYKSVAKSVDFALRSRLYNTNVTKNTKLSDIMGKVVLIIDKTLNRNYAKSSSCKPKESGCYDLTQYINMESGSETLFLQRYSELLNQCAIPPNVLDKCDGVPANSCTDISKMRLVLPDSNFKNTQNPEYNDFVSKFGCQLLTYRFYMLDKGLKNYETFFDDNKTAFVPLAHAIRYIKNTSLKQE